MLEKIWIGLLQVMREHASFGHFIGGAHYLDKKSRKNADPEFVNVKGAQKSIPRNRFRQPM
jgi:hypothetical protein